MVNRDRRRLRPVGDSETPPSEVIGRLLPEPETPGDDTPAPAAEPDAAPETTGSPAPDDAPAKPKPPDSDREETRRAAIIAAPYQRDQIGRTLADFGIETAYRAGFHGTRLPLYTAGSLL